MAINFLGGLGNNNLLRGLSGGAPGAAPPVPSPTPGDGFSPSKELAGQRPGQAPDISGLLGSLAGAFGEKQQPQAQQENPVEKLQKKLKEAQQKEAQAQAKGDQAGAEKAKGEVAELIQALLQLLGGGQQSGQGGEGGGQQGGGEAAPAGGQQGGGGRPGGQRPRRRGQGHAGEARWGRRGSAAVRQLQELQQLDRRLQVRPVPDRRLQQALQAGCAQDCPAQSRSSEACCSQAESDAAQDRSRTHQRQDDAGLAKDERS